MARNDGIVTDEATGLITEGVSGNYEPRPSRMATRDWFVAYPPNVVAYGHEDDRVSRAWGSGDNRNDALRAATEYMKKHGAVIS